MKIIKPKALQPGDTIAIVAPASNLKADYLARGIAEIERLGFRVRHEDGILSKDRYTAGSDKRRAEELMNAFTDETVRAVWAARGGYGAMRLFDLLDPERLRPHPKIFIGYSDLTALHLLLFNRFGWVTFHGPMAAKDLTGGEPAFDRGSLLRSLTGSDAIGTIGHNPLEVLHSGNSVKVNGRLIGGCLSLISATMGTEAEIDTRDAILFLEDTGTKPFALDRMLQQLRLSGKFDEIRGIVFGEMTDCMQHPDQGYTLQQVLADCTAGLGVPVLFGLPSGHSPVGNLTLPLGVQATLLPREGRLVIEETGVSG